MEILVLLLVLLAVSMVALGAKHGAEAAQQRRDERWRGFSAARVQPAAMPGGRPDGARPPGAAQAVRGGPSRLGGAAPQSSPGASEPSGDASSRPMRPPESTPQPAAGGPVLGAFRRTNGEPAEPASQAPKGKAATVAAPPSGRRSGAATASRAEEAARRAAGSAAQNATATARSFRATASAALRREPVPIDINRAPVSELQNLPGVGVRAAQRIVAHRERNGDFRSVEDLSAVEGFDQHRVSRLAPRATV